MAYLHRKILQKSTEIFVVIKKPCPPHLSCDDDLEPPPPPSDHTLSPYLIFMFCGLAVSFLIICYLTFVKRSRRRLRNQENIANHETHEDLVNEDLGPVIDHPIWLINTVGLDQSQIESILVFKYKKDESLIEGTDCSVCLSEFEDDESLRLLPKCNHAFHVPCIDTWLRSHKNCPLCRAPIIKNTNDQTDDATTESNLIESNTSEETETPVVSSETMDHHVVEVENNGETEKTLGSLDETRVRVHSDLADHHRVQGQELLAMRRSFSNSQLSVSKKLISNMPKSEHKLKGSSSSIHIRSKVMKSSSFGHSSRKPISSFTNKGPHNRSY